MSDAREALFQHKKYQQQSKTKMYQSATHISTLMNMSINLHTGTRVEFLSKRFSKRFQTLHKLDMVIGRTTQLEIARTLLMKSVASDTDLTRDYQQPIYR